MSACIVRERSRRQSIRRRDLLQLGMLSPKTRKTGELLRLPDEGDNNVEQPSKRFAFNKCVDA